MRRITVSSIFLALAMVLILATGCQEAQQTADLRVTLDENASRTLNPSSADFEVVKYHVTCQDTGNTSNPIEIDTVRTSLVIQGLPVGKYNLLAKGLNSKGETIIQGSTTFDLSPTNTAALITLKEMVGSGAIDIDFSWDSSLVTDPSVKVSLTPVDGQNLEEISKTLDPGSGSSVTFAQSSLPTGSYRLVANLYSGNTRVAGCVEAVRVGNSATVEAALSFNLDKLPDSAGQITLVNKAGVPVVCTISGLSETVQAQSAVNVTLSAESIDEDSLSVLWYLDGEQIGTTTTATFYPAPGKHRLDVIASTSKLGSTGSTTVTFEAALLGETGVPVLGDEVTENEVAGLGLDSDMIVEFLPEGYLMIVDNSTMTAQMASIKRNTLEIVGTTTLSKKVTHMGAIEGASRIALVFEDAESASYSYNVGTGKITLCYSDNRQITTSTTNLMTKVYGLMRKSYDTNLYGVVGKMATQNATYMDMAAFHDAVNQAELYASFNNLQASSIDYDLFSCLNTGDDAILVDKGTNTVTLLFVAPDTGKPRNVNGTISMTSPTATQSLPASDTNTFRFVIADGDSFSYYERDRTKANGAATMVAKGTLARTEGSSLNTVQLILSYSGDYLYALNRGDNSISTYGVSSEGVLSYVSKTDLSFTPKSACLSSNDSYMVVTGTAGQLAIMRIKTSE